ncbi:ScbR family autoregulator-binding transcription factor [Streptomyces canus]|uniref:ScbR family autoregulator-binding transcription factor n=1 Tax=Streptomyces canus TaxID=58343 RepID=UPI002E268126
MVRQERAVRTRQAVLVAAAEIFDQVGYDAASISDILARSGVTKGALYFHFPSKKDLAQGVLDAQVDALPAVPVQELKLQQSLDEALLLAHLLRKETGDPIVRGSVRLTVEQGSSKDGLDRRVPMRRWIEHTQGLFEEAKQAGEILPHIDVEAVAKLAVGAFTGIQVLSNIMMDRADMPERVIDLYRNLMAAIAAPAVLARLQFDVGRGAEVFEESVRLRENAELASP